MVVVEVETRHGHTMEYDGIIWNLYLHCDTLTTEVTNPIGELMPLMCLGG